MFTGFVAETLPLPYVSTTFVAETLPLFFCDAAVVIHAMFNISRDLHDMLDGDVMSMEDERKQVSNLIISFIDKVKKTPGSSR